MQIGCALADTVTRHNGVGVADRSDDALMTAVAKGDKLALKVLYARHNVRVYRFALRVTRDETLAEDVVSEVFLHAWRGAKNFQSKSKVSTWLLAIAHNKAKDALQRRRHEYLSDDDAAANAHLAKACASDTYTQTAIHAVQIHGGIGFTWDNDTHLWFKRAKSSEVLLGDASHHRELMMQNLAA